jgi:PqqD family protein of HPr-rel-A system
MARAAMTRPECFRIPPDVEFQRWQGDDDWVIYHTGTGETLRVSEMSLAILDVIAQHASLDAAGLLKALTTLFDEPPDAGELRAGMDEHMRLLLSHECVERCPCA